MKLFITGATGFIGGYLIQRLKSSNHQLVCLVRKQSNLRSLEGSGAKLIEGDVAEKRSFLDGMRGCDCVINVANVYSFWEPDKRIYHRVNVEGTRNIMEAALETGVAKVVHVSTVGVYGRPGQLPFTEETPVGPVRFSEYTRTKYEGELIAQRLREERNLPLVLIYPGAVLGPGDPKATGRYVSDLVHRRVPARVCETSVMTYVHVRDVAEAIVRAAEKEGNVGEKYIVANQQLFFAEINRMVSEIAQVPLPKISMPNWLATVNAALLTALSSITRKPPLWGLSIDQLRIMKYGFEADGSKAERELGISYTPIRATLEETIAALER